MGDKTGREAELKRKFWKELEASPFMMLGLQGVEDSRTRPMTAQIDIPYGADDEDGGQIYFFGTRSEHLVQGLDGEHRAVATFVSKGHGLFAHIHGTLAIDNDRAVIDRLWGPVIASWYKHGKDDPDLVLLRFDTEQADIWEADPGSMFKAALIKLFGRDPGKNHQKNKQAEEQLS
ncbi:MAG TPA: pyridoxamine 5'-phosphate oxidase family protein [Sphingomicrobium sp.]|nr:pyridoxamine 5'-phosphate oxidase family protein [Sphingomicrobium sp.]